MIPKSDSPKLPEKNPFSDFEQALSLNLASLESIQAIHEGRRYYYYPQDHKFYPSGSKTAGLFEAFEKRVVNVGLTRLAEGTGRFLTRQNYQETLKGLEDISTDIIDTLQRACSIAMYADDPAQLSHLRERVQVLLDKIDKAEEGLHHLRETYQNKPKKVTEVDASIEKYHERVGRKLQDFEDRCKDAAVRISEQNARIKEKTEELKAKTEQTKVAIEEVRTGIEELNQQISASKTLEEKAKELIRKDGTTSSPPSSDATSSAGSSPLSSASALEGEAEFDPSRPFYIKNPQTEAQRKFNKDLETWFKPALEYIAQKQEAWFGLISRSDQDRIKIKPNVSHLPWTIVVTKKKQIFIHFKLPIVENPEDKGKLKSDKKAFEVTTQAPIAKLSMKALRSERQYDQLLMCQKGEAAALEACKNLNNVVHMVDLLSHSSPKDKGITQEGLKHIFYLAFYHLGDLRQNFNKLSTEQKQIVILDLINGLFEMHQIDYVHGDLKPANILLDQNKRAYLADLGFAGPVGKEATGGGTPYYNPPEEFEFRSLSYIRRKEKDVWALGCIIYRLLTGNDPDWLKGKTRSELVENLNKSTYFKSKPNDPVLEIVWEMLKKDPKERLTIGQAKERFDKLYGPIAPPPSTIKT
jgi:predicted  nucleic acid-binding Zn-ribbon protein